MLIVDDQSPDGTGQLADDLAVRYPGRLEVMHRTGRRGLGRSYIDGIKRAIKEPVDVSARWTRTFRTTRRICPASWRPRRTPTSSSARDTSRAARS